MVAASAQQGGWRNKTFLGHPLGLYVLFFTEMWERFSYYGMRALLILYMVNYFKWEQKEASTYYKVYTSFVYVTPILGGFLADRYLGNRWAVIIGAMLMSIGHFLMAFEDYPIFMAALIFLIFGNGFFKPNMSVQVGRLYAANDGRRDGAYTIFYMGINLGGFLSPLVCGWLVDNTVGGFHSGFTMAGIGMVLGMMIYLLGQPLIKELPPDALAETAPDHGMKETAKAAVALPLSEAEAARTPSVLGEAIHYLPGLFGLLGTGLILAAPLLVWQGITEIWNGVMLGIGGFCLGLIAFVSSKVRGGMRDRVLAILILGVFVMFFWAAFEQAGNVLNLWADQSTNRYLTRQPAAPEVIPTVEEDQEKTVEEMARDNSGFGQRFLNLFINMVTLKEDRQAGPEQSLGEQVEGAFNPIPTAWFQAINALAIFLLAPLFAWLWVYLDRRGWQPSIPMKMVLGLLLMSASMSIMMVAARQENKRTAVAFSAERLPSGIIFLSDGRLAYHSEEEGEDKPFHAGRLTWDKDGKQLVMLGVLTENERDRLIEETAPPSFRESVKQLQTASRAMTANNQTKAIVTLTEAPPGFDMKYAGLKKSVVQFDPQTRQLVAFKELREKEIKGLLKAAGEPIFRDTVNGVFVQSTTFRVTSWWLFWSYILATLGELCLSPVGLSMVSKLAPAKFATMLMGVWMLTSAFGNFAAGALGEIWGTVPPFQFFLLSTVVVGGAALVLLVLVRFVTATMHGVK